MRDCKKLKTTDVYSIFKNKEEEVGVLGVFILICAVLFCFWLTGRDLVVLFAEESL